MQHPTGDRLLHDNHLGQIIIVITKDLVNHMQYIYYKIRRGGNYENAFFISDYN